MRSIGGRTATQCLLVVHSLAARRAVPKLSRPFPASTVPTCPRCRGTGWEETDGAERCVKRCICCGDQQLESNSPTRISRSPHLRAQLDRIQTYGNRGLKRAVERAQRFCDEFPVVDKGLLGPAGVGKTLIAIAVIRELATSKLVHGVYHDTRIPLGRLRASYDPQNREQSEHRILEPVLGAEVLILDDIGAERSTEWADEMLSRIIQDGTTPTDR